MRLIQLFAWFGARPGRRRLRRFRIPVCGAECSVFGGRPVPRRIRVFDPGGRPGPRRLRPFLAFFGPPTAPRSAWTASCTCSRTMSRITVTRLFRRGMQPPSSRPSRFRQCENGSGELSANISPSPSKASSVLDKVGPSQRGRLAAPVRERQAFSARFVAAAHRRRGRIFQK